MRRLPLIVTMLLALPSALIGDTIPAGLKRVRQDVVLEVGEDARNYRFWLRSGFDPYRSRVVSLPLVPGQPYRVQPASVPGRYPPGLVIAVPQALVDQMGEQEVEKTLRNNQRLPGAFSSEALQFEEHISTYDSRECVVVRYRLEVRGGKSLGLVFLGDNAHENTASDGWLRGAVIVAGVLLSGLGVWFGWYVARRSKQAQPVTQ